MTDREVDVVTFASSSMVRNFAACLSGDDLPELMRDVLVACIGPITAQTAAEVGIPVHVKPKEYTIEALVAAIAEARPRTRETTEG